MTTCGSNSICSGLPTSPPTFTCSCQTGFVPSNGNGKNCIANCTSDSACGTNSYCNTATGVCSCNSGYYSPNANGINCIAPTTSCKSVIYVRSQSNIEACDGIYCANVSPSLWGYTGPDNTAYICGVTQVSDINCVFPANATVM